MGYSIELYDKNGVVEVPRHSAGSIIAIDVKSGTVGQVEAHISITYNYTPLYVLATGKSLSKTLHDMKAKDSISFLEEIVQKLGTDQYRRLKEGKGVNDMFKDENYEYDYWCPTMGNAGYIVSILLSWVKLHPDAIWRVLG